jgi:hypothetical protein
MGFGLWLAWFLKATLSIRMMFPGSSKTLSRYSNHPIYSINTFVYDFIGSTLRKEIRSPATQREGENG